MSLELSGLSTNYGAVPSKQKAFPTQPSGTSADDALSLEKAVKAYRNEYLTGQKELTDEQKDEIKCRIEKYLEKYKLDTKEDKDAFNAYVKSVFKSMGFHGYVEDYVEGDVYEYMDSILNTGTQSSASTYDMVEHVRSVSGQGNRFKITTAFDDYNAK